jgi:hypothetical protein
MKLKPFMPGRYRRRVFSQLWMLALQFVLGMTLNLFGSGTKNGWQTLYTVILVLHILNALGLLEGAIFIALKSPSRVAWGAAIAIFLTCCAGTLTVLTGADAWSFVMAIGFLASCWLTVMLYLRSVIEFQLQAK